MKFTRFMFSVAVLTLASGVSYAQQSASSGLAGLVTDSSQGAIPVRLVRESCV